MKAYLYYSSLAILTILTSENAIAQATPAVSSPEIDDIVVTARKRAESIQDVPVSVTAVDSAAIERRSITKIDQIAAITPNVQLQSISVNPTNLAPYIRGVGQRANEPSQDVPIAISVDGVYLSSQSASLLDVFDLEQIEILRGPQGTLQGRNSPGGAINASSRRPSGDFGVRAEASYARFDLFDAKASIEAPIVKDILAVKLAGFYKNGGGYVRNIIDGSRTGGGVDAWGGRLGLLFTPNDAVNIYVTADYTNDHSPQAAIRPVPVAVAQGPRQPVPLICVFGNVCAPYGEYENGSDYTRRNRSQSGGLAVNADYDFGPVTLTSVTGYRKSNEYNNADVDATPVSFISVVDRNTRVNQFSQEIRLASNGKTSLEYVVGAYFLRYKFELHQPLSVFGTISTADRQQVTNSYAVFGQATYHITDKWSVSGGARQSWDRKAMLTEPVVPGPEGRFRVGFDNLSLEAGTEYKFTRDHLLYFRFSQGYRAGGINGDAPTPALVSTYRPEKINSYEVGVKTEWFDRVLQVNLSAFHYDYNDVQVDVSTIREDTGGIYIRVRNAAGVKTDGVELETVLRPAEGLALRGSLGYLDNRYKVFNVDLGFGPGDQSALRRPYSPKWSGNVGFDYDLPLNGGENGRLRLGSNLSFRSSSANSPLDNPIDNQPAYALLDASIGYQAANERYTVTLFGQNLTNKYYITNGETGGGAFAFHAVGRPISYGVKLAVRY